MSTYTFSFYLRHFDGGFNPKDGTCHFNLVVDILASWAWKYLFFSSMGFIYLAKPCFSFWWLHYTYPSLQGFSLEMVIKKLGTLWSNKFEPTSQLGTTFTLPWGPFSTFYTKRYNVLGSKGWPTFSLSTTIHISS